MVSFPVIFSFSAPTSNIKREVLSASPDCESYPSASERKSPCRARVKATYATRRSSSIPARSRILRDGKEPSFMQQTNTCGNSRPLAVWTVMSLTRSFLSSVSAFDRRETELRYSSALTFPSACTYSRTDAFSSFRLFSRSCPPLSRKNASYPLICRI